jgi:hypothetical protein
MAQSQIKDKYKLQLASYISVHRSPSSMNCLLPRGVCICGGTGSSSLFSPLLVKLCATTAAVSLVACHSRLASAILFFCSVVCLRELPQEREQYSPRLLCSVPHLRQFLVLYAILQFIFDLQPQKDPYSRRTLIFRYHVHHARTHPK